MTPQVRKGVLLRLRPEVLAAVDRARGLQKRTDWLTGVILRELDRLDRPADEVERSGLMSRTAPDDVETSAGLLADEGEELATEYSPANDANGGSGLDGEPPEMGDPAELSSLEGSDISELAPGDDL